MELVYLWVKNYKNIVEQGFNFSPRFRCDYDEEKNELTINENKDYVSIFPENINVTAIVGENGSGKSSVSTQIQNIFFQAIYENAMQTKNCFIVYVDFGNKLKLLTDRNTVNISCNIEIEKLSQIDELIKFPSFDYSITVNPFLFNIQYNLQENSVMNTFPQYPSKFHGQAIGIDINAERRENQKLMVSNYLKNPDYLKVCKNFFVPSRVKFLDDEKMYTIEEVRNKQLNNIETIFSTKELDINILSYGELQLLTILNRIFNLSQEKNTKEFVIFFDEIDLGLHPRWQSKIISYILDYLKVAKKRFHLIITSHSPFILSDIPKENVIFLEKGKQVYPFEDGKQTFGANIHTLLSHGFFMKDGLMGEFAKDKINLAITYLNEPILTKEKLDYCENIISIIGEPIIKRELQRMLDSKRLSKIDKIDEIEKQIEELQKELKKIKND